MVKQRMYELHEESAIFLRSLVSGTKVFDARVKAGGTEGFSLDSPTLKCKKHLIARSCCVEVFFRPCYSGVGLVWYMLIPTARAHGPLQLGTLFLHSLGETVGLNDTRQARSWPRTFQHVRHSHLKARTQLQNPRVMRCRWSPTACLLSKDCPLL